MTPFLSSYAVTASSSLVCGKLLENRGWRERDNDIFILKTLLWSSQQFCGVERFPVTVKIVMFPRQRVEVYTSHFLWVVSSRVGRVFSKACLAEVSVNRRHNQSLSPWHGEHVRFFVRSRKEEVHPIKGNTAYRVRISFYRQEVYPVRSPRGKRYFWISFFFFNPQRVIESINASEQTVLVIDHVTGVLIQMWRMYLFCATRITSGFFFDLFSSRWDIPVYVIGFSCLFLNLRYQDSACFNMGIAVWIKQTPLCRTSQSWLK